jgi:membrane protein GlpM
MEGSWIHYAILALAGAAISTLLGVLARQGHYFLIGLVPLFPTFAIIGHLLAANAANTVGLRVAATFGLYSLLPYGCYLLATIICLRYWSAYLSIIIGICAWFVVAFVLVYCWNRSILPGST